MAFDGRAHPLLLASAGPATCARRTSRALFPHQNVSLCIADAI